MNSAPKPTIVLREAVEPPASPVDNRSFFATAADFVIRTLPKTPYLRRIAVGGIFLLLAILISASMFATAPTPQPKERLEKAWPVSITSVVIDDIGPTFETYGRVESSDVASLAVDVVAPVKAVYVKEGQWVQAGALLVELDERELDLRLQERRAELQRSQAALRSIETEFEMTKTTTSHYEAVQRISQSKLERHEELFEQRMISQGLFDEVVQQTSESTIQYQAHMRALADFPNRIAEQSALSDGARALLERAEINLAKARMVAPFDGPVLEVTAAPGDRTQPGRPLVRIASTANIEVRAPVPDLYNGRFRAATDAGSTIRATALVDGSPTPLILNRLAGNVRSGQSGLDAFFRIDPSAEVGRGPEIGRVLDVSIQLPVERAVVALPAPSIYEGNRIYVVEEQRLRSVGVDRIGEHTTTDGQYRVLVRSDELGNGDRVITTQLPKAITGLKVEVAGDPASEPVAAAES